MSKYESGAGCSVHGPVTICGHTDSTCPGKRAVEQKDVVTEQEVVHESISNETESGVKEYLEAARTIGDFYNNFLTALTRREQLSEEGVGALPSPVRTMFKKMIENTRKYQEIYDLRMRVGNLTKKDILRQAFPSADEHLLNQEDSYRLEEINIGIYGIFIQREIFDKFRPGNGAQAMAVKINKEDGIPFVILPESKYRSAEDMQNFLKENVPHETNHLVWGFMENEGDTFVDEQEGEMKRAFLMYREELLCRLSSDGIVGGYTHLRPGSLALKRMQEHDLVLLNKIQAFDEVLYDLCAEINRLLARTSEIRKVDLIAGVMEAQNFPVLIENLQKMKKIIEDAVPAKVSTDSSGNGWGSVERW